MRVRSRYGRPRRCCSASRKPFVGLIVLRLAVGALEAPAYPINNRVVTTWFPTRERASAIGGYTSGQFVGLAFLTPVLAWLQVHLGWHMVFVATGLAGIVWAAIWYAVYREPRAFRGVNAAEIALIRDGGGPSISRIASRHAPNARRRRGATSASCLAGASCGASISASSR